MLQILQSVRRDTQRVLLCCLLVGFGSGLAVADEKLTPELLLEGLVAPIDLATLPDGSERRLILDQSGVVHLLQANGELASAPFLDITERLLPLREDFEERGLLGMAIHPDYQTNGRLFVSYSGALASDAPANWNHTRIVSEFTVDPDNTDRLNAESERVLIRQHWPSRKHNGGALAFGPDGYLYVGFGDGGGIHGVGPETLNDAYSVPVNRRAWDSTAQDLQSLYGKILRIDVDHGYPGYAIPADNPLVGKLGRDEIYAWGFRNPYRISFDPDNSARFYITAVAETLWEAIYRVDQPGNYGWPLREGTHCFERIRPLDPPSDCANETGAPIFDPVVEYANMSVHREGSKVTKPGVGTAVVGSVMLRESVSKDLANHLLIADWSRDFRQPSGQLFIAAESAQPPWALEQIAQLDTRIVALVQDEGRLYVMTNDNFGPYGQTGKVFELKLSE